MAGTAIRRIGPDEWVLLRRLRLEALQEAPAAFGSTYEQELAFDEERWRSRLETSAYFVAEFDHEVVGMVCAVRLAEPDDERPPTMELVSMWVAPGQRRRGTGALLVDAVLGYARSEGEPVVGLWVAKGNEVAEALYRSAGFERTREEQGMPGRPEECEVRMAISL